MALDPKSVFDLHPDINEIYVVDDMPFLRKVDALAYEKSTGQTLQTYTREAKAEKLKAEKAPVTESKA